MNAVPNLRPDEYQAFLRNDLTSFIHRSFVELNPGIEFIPGKYIELLASKLEQCRTGETKRLIINIPPRSLKSHAASVAFPAWLLGHDPTTQIICASYGQDLADKHARDSRTLMNSPIYRRLFPRTALSGEKSSVNDFMTTQQGFRMSTSVGGTLTGRGADIIILDDVMKPDEALSDVRRNAVNEWYLHTLLSRLNSKENGVIIIVMQRLHQADLVGELMEREDWDVLSLPAIATTDEFYRYRSIFGTEVFSRRAGEALHPERDSVETFNRIRGEVGEYNFQSQYQQEPMPREGGLVKRDWLRFYEPNQLPKTFDYVLQSWDTANKAGQMNDFSVGTTWGLHNGKIYLIDVWRNRVGFPELKKAVIARYQMFSPHKLVIEDKSSGTALIQELQGAGLCGIQFYRPDSGSDKYVRFAAQAIRFEAGYIYLPSEAHWLDDYIREITGFPGTKHDDQVDSTAQALDVLVEEAKGIAFMNWVLRPVIRVRETC